MTARRWIGFLCLAGLAAGGGCSAPHRAGESGSDPDRTLSDACLPPRPPLSPEEFDRAESSESLRFFRLFADDRVFAVTAPSGPGVRGANGNGPFYLYEWTGGRWRMAYEFGGYEYECNPDAQFPVLIATERIDRDTIGRSTHRWNGSAFERTRFETAEYPGE